MSAKSEWTSTVLSQQTRDRSPNMVDRNCNWNLGLWSLIHDPRPQWQSRVYRRNRAHLKPICYDGTSFQDHPVKKEEKQPEINSFQDPKPTKVKTVSFQNGHQLHGCQIHVIWWTNTHQTPPPSPIIITSVAILTQVTIISPPASLPSRESSVEPHSEDSSPTGRKRHQSEPAFIRPHDIDRGLTPRLSALLQETSPLAPYKLERSAKARARQAFSTMHWTPFKTP